MPNGSGLVHEKKLLPPLFVSEFWGEKNAFSTWARFSDAAFAETTKIGKHNFLPFLFFLFGFFHICKR